jgi:hypothetical protein
MPEMVRRERVAWLDLARDTVLEVRECLPTPEVAGDDTSGYYGGHTAPGGELLLRLGRHRLAWLTAAGEPIATIAVPGLEPQYPSERDVEEYAASLRRILGVPPEEEPVRAFRAREKPAIRARAFRVDGAGRLWAATERPSARDSFLEVFDPSGAHLGAIEVEDQLIALEIHDALLMVLAEAREPDAEGFYPRRLDWYRIVERGEG